MLQRPTLLYSKPLITCSQRHRSSLTTRAQAFHSQNSQTPPPATPPFPFPFPFPFPLVPPPSVWTPSSYNPLPSFPPSLSTPPLSITHFLNTNEPPLQSNPNPQSLQSPIPTPPIPNHSNHPIHPSLHSAETTLSAKCNQLITTLITNYRNILHP
ncbi:hypothetical protein F5050DRAFT_1811393 [Lentinula boryana]|uniref:Uncharacterized protein n=1 Tax=Lentinula boryana TaxID=40481 RepID=A0ABQ8Q253_9AGAR|nr:hypothetical protein F5050DRAFT_1811393 [Lentinula boryana]